MSPFVALKAYRRKNLMNKKHSKENASHYVITNSFHGLMGHEIPIWHYVISTGKQSPVWLCSSRPAAFHTVWHVLPSLPRGCAMEAQASQPYIGSAKDELKGATWNRTVLCPSFIGHCSQEKSQATCNTSGICLYKLGWCSSLLFEHLSVIQQMSQLRRGSRAWPTS